MCKRSGSGERTACSDQCAAALAKADKATELLIRMTAKTARVSAVAFYLCGAGFVVAGVAVTFALPGDIFLPCFCCGLGVVLIICGFLYTRASKHRLN